MKIIYLEEFIRTGRFDTITIDSTKDEIIHTLGNGFDFYDSGETQIISYGWYEFFCWTNTGKVLGIQNDHLLADCNNHAEMINSKTTEWILDIWFLKEGQNITFKETKKHLTRANIPFKIQPTYKGCDENIIKCLESSVSFDFSSEYRLNSLNSKEISITTEVKLEIENDFVLNGIRLFETF